MKFGMGFSKNEDSRSAVEEAAKKALKGRPVFSMIFTTGGYKQEAVVETANELFRGSKFVGICGAGILTSEKTLKRGVGVLTFYGDIKVETSIQKPGDNLEEVGRTAGRDLLKSGISGGTVFVFPESSSKNISETITSLYNTMGPDYTYLGGVSGYDFDSNSCQFTEMGVANGGFTAVLVNGLSIKTACGHGWKPRNVPLIMNRVQNKKVLEINGKTALEVYRAEADAFNTTELKMYGIPNPLGFPDLDGNFMIRDPIEINHDGSMDFLTEIQPNSMGYLMEADLDDIINNTQEVAEAIKKQGRKPDLLLVFNCLFYYNLVKRKSKGISLGDIFHDVPVFGVLTFGEVGSYSEVPMLQNKTLIIAAVYGDE